MNLKVWSVIGQMLDEDAKSTQPREIIKRDMKIKTWFMLTYKFSLFIRNILSAYFLGSIQCNSIIGNKIQSK